jgi:hypothetical protein
MNGLPVNPDKTWHAGADEKTPMEHTRNSVRLVSVIDGPTSANASPTRFSRGKDGSWRFIEFTSKNIWFTPSCAQTSLVKDGTNRL